MAPQLLANFFYYTNPLGSYKAIQHKHMRYSIRMHVLYQTTLTKITNKSGGYRIMLYNHVMTLNLNIFKIILSFSPPYNIGQAPSLPP
jgi:hypothetical protein